MSGKSPEMETSVPGGQLMEIGFSSGALEDRPKFVAVKEQLTAAGAGVPMVRKDLVCIPDAPILMLGVLSMKPARSVRGNAPVQPSPSSGLRSMLTRAPLVPTEVANPVSVMVAQVLLWRVMVMTQLPPLAAPDWVWLPFPAHTTIFSLWALVAPTS